MNLPARMWRDVRAQWRVLSPGARHRARLVLAACALACVLALGWVGVVAQRAWPASESAALRERAALALREGRLSAADGSGARQLYEAALALQPDQVEARDGLAQVALAALARAEAALAAGDARAAADELRLARELQAPHARVAVVERGLRERELDAAGIDALLARADAARSDGRLDGSAEAALPLYQRVLVLQPRNQQAVEGREDALTDLLQPAGDALARGDAAALSLLVWRAEQFDPGHADLPDLRAGLARLLEARRAALQAHVAAGRYERAAETCLALRALPGHAGWPAVCAERVLDGLVDRGNAAIAASDFTAAQEILVVARSLAGDDRRVQMLDRRLASARRAPATNAPGDARQRSARLAMLLRDAADAQARGDWLTPPGDSAWDKLREARSLAPDSPEVRAAWRGLEPGARTCLTEALRNNHLGEAGACLDVWQQVDADDAELPAARRRLALRWVAVGDERLGAGEIAVAQRALERARALDPSVPGLDELSARLAHAQSVRP
jgi:hypothetical protein